jgi:hypothetical protein
LVDLLSNGLRSLLEFVILRWSTRVSVFLVLVEILSNDFRSPMGMRSERRPFGSVSTNTDRAGTMTDQGRVMDLRSERRPLKSVSTNTQTVDTNLDQENRVNVRSERKSFDSISTKTKKTDTLVTVVSAV